MRELTGHQVNECNKQIKVFADEPDPKTGSVQTYVLQAPFGILMIPFHVGPISDGVNGCTQEALNEVLIDRLEKLQAGPFAHPANAKALEHYKAAREALRERTAERIERGVEGTHQV
jgi:hypothetical protein